MRAFLWWAGRIVATVLVIGCIAIVVARAFKIDFGPFAYLVPLIPYCTVVLLVALVLSLVTRWWIVAGVGALALALIVFWWLPPFINSPANAKPTLVAATSNIALGEGDACAVVAMVKQHKVDLLAVEEMTPESLIRLNACGLFDLLPHSYVEPRGGASGTGMFSKYPISNAHGNQSTALANLEAQVELPNGQQATWLAVHVAGIVPGEHPLWDAEAKAMPAYVGAFRGPVILTGDFNSTRDQPLILNLESVGYADSATVAGSGLVRTFPSDFPFVGIDHVMTRELNMSALSTSVVLIPGSDHRAFVATYG